MNCKYIDINVCKKNAKSPFQKRKCLLVNDDHEKNASSEASCIKYEYIHKYIRLLLHARQTKTNTD